MSVQSGEAGEEEKEWDLKGGSLDEKVGEGISWGQEGCEKKVKAA